MICILLSFLFMGPVLFLKSSFDGCFSSIFSSLFSPHIALSDLEKADIRNRNNTGAMLSPCLTPSSSDISAIDFLIFNTTTKSVYIYSTHEQNLGGAPHCSNTLISTLWCVL